MVRFAIALVATVREPDAAARLPPPETGHMAVSFDPTNAAPSIGEALADVESHCVALVGHAAVAEPLVMSHIDLLAARYSTAGTPDAVTATAIGDWVWLADDATAALPLVVGYLAAVHDAPTAGAATTAPAARAAAISRRLGVVDMVLL